MDVSVVNANGRQDGRRSEDVRRGARGVARRGDVPRVSPVVRWMREFLEFADGKVRHASFQGLREDKAAREVVQEVAMDSRVKPGLAKRSPAKQGEACPP